MNVAILASEVAEVDGIVERFTSFPLVFIAMPFVAALIGYVTKIAAIRMMFEPIEFKGLGKFGWQGILPKRAARMASTVVDTMTRDLVDAREIIAKIDPDRMAKELEGPLLDSMDKIARDVLHEVQPGLWESLPEQAKRLVLSRIRSEVPVVLARILDDMRTNIDEVFDLKHMVVSNLIKDKRLLNEIFRKVGHKEFRFIINSGIPFGFAIGIVQAGVYLVFPNPIVLPAFGLFVGYFTDWLALKMLFYPKEPRRILGITVHGLFLKRQKEVTKDYSALLAEEILTPRNFFDALLTGPYSDALFQMTQRHVQQVVDQQAGRARPLVVLAVGSRQYEDLKKRAAQRLMDEMPTTMEHAMAYTEEAIDIRNTITEKMDQMTPTQFEGLLRPAFQADEWILVTVGALLGFTVGLSQDLVLVPFFAQFGGAA
ncbi:MAG: DUF445 domain-containing protein [Acidimicrobiales bacterium]